MFALLRHFSEHISFTHSFAVPANVKVATCEKQKIYFSSPLLHGQWPPEPLNWFLSFLPLLWHLNRALERSVVETGAYFSSDVGRHQHKRYQNFANVALVAVSVFPVRNILLLRWGESRIFQIKHRYLTRTRQSVYFSLSSSHCTLVH